MEVSDKVLKTDARGRVWTPPEDRDRLLDELERSGVPATKFAALVGVKYQMLVSGIQKRRRTRVAEVPKAAALNRVEAPVHCRPTSSSLVVQLPGGINLTVSDAVQSALAGQLLRAYSSSVASCGVFTGRLRVFLCVEPCDMRKGFEGLHALVSERLTEDVRSGPLFVLAKNPLGWARACEAKFEGTHAALPLGESEKGELKARFSPRNADPMRPSKPANPSQRDLYFMHTGSPFRFRAISRILSGVSNDLPGVGTTARHNGGFAEPT